MKTAARLLAFLRPTVGQVALSVLLGAGTVAASVGLMGAAAYLISAAALHPSIAELQVAIVGVRFFGVSRGVLRYAERLVSHSVNFRLLAALRTWFYRALEPLAPARLLAYRSGDLLARAVSDVETLEDFFVRAVAPPLSAALVFVGILIFLGGFAPELAALQAAFLLLAGVGVPLLALVLSRRPGCELVELRARLAALLVDAIQGLGDALAFGHEGDQAAHLAELNGAIARAERHMAWIGGLNAGLSTLLGPLSVWGLLVLAIPLVESGRLPGVFLAVLALSALASFEAVAPLPLAAQTLEGSLRAARRLFEIVDAPPAVTPPADPQPFPTAAGLSIRGLRFRYAPGDPPALDGLELDLVPGRRVALVGPSGSGKTTLIHLLLRFWDFTEGEIRLGGVDVRALDPEALRRTFGVISQSTYLFDATLAENLRLAAPDATRAEIARAADAARLGELIARLPQGLEAWVGEHGLRLSAGERQRVAVARALLKDAPVLLLDEPTASLDAVTERQVLAEILDAAEGRSLILVSHRLVGLEGMDEICVLQAGRVTERGTQAELLAGGGFYARMWAAQNRPLLP